MSFFIASGMLICYIIINELLFCANFSQFFKSQKVR